MNPSQRPSPTGGREPETYRLSRRQWIAMGGWFAGACCLAIPLPCSAAPVWRDRRNYGPFNCQATFSLNSYAPMFQELSSLELELQRTLAVPPAGKSVDVYLFQDEPSHREFLSTLYPRVPYRRALYVQRGGQGAVYAYRHPELAVDLRHECTHALLHTNLPMVPLWLDEGLAEYFELPQSDRASEHPHLAKLRWNLRLGMLHSIESLEQQQELKDMGGAEYRFSWAWVHFMLHGPVPAHRSLVQYLADIRRGTPPGLLSARLRSAVPHLETTMIQHFKHWRG